MKRPKKLCSANKVRYLLAGSMGAVLVQKHVYGVPKWRWTAGVVRVDGRPVTFQDLYRERKNPMRLPKGSEGGSVPTQYCPPGDLAKKYPTLAGFLVNTTYEGSDQKRDPGTLSVRPCSEGFVLTLRDATSHQQLRMVVPGLLELFPALETLLKAPEAPWEGDQYAKPRFKLKKPKGG